MDFACDSSILFLRFLSCIDLGFSQRELNFVRF